jgi:hypothetical protein
VNVPIFSLELYTPIHQTSFGESWILIALMCAKYTPQRKASSEIILSYFEMNQIVIGGTLWVLKILMF